MVSSLFDKLWASRVIVELDDERSLIHVDRHLLHEFSSPQAFAGLRAAGQRVFAPDLAMAVPDHVVDTQLGRGDNTVPGGSKMIAALRQNARSNAIRLFDLDDPRQGIVHVVAAENGVVLPGMVVACGDSHTCTLGALGCWAFGIGSSEVQHILATQTLAMHKPESFRLRVTGARAPGVSAKDLALGIIHQIGVGAARGGVLEFAGPAVEALSMDERFTLCNMGIEASARAALIKPDAKTFDFVAGTPGWPEQSDRAIAYWKTLVSDDDAKFDGEFTFDCSVLAPQVTWGTTPAQTIPVDGTVPILNEFADATSRAAALRALNYMGLEPGQQLIGLPIDKVFIGSCTNSRLSDLIAAAGVIRARKVATRVKAIVVPGSSQVKAQAEALGIHRTFIEAGFEWRESGCSMCVGMNADKVGAEERCVSTSNRNFEGRQGKGARTHLASPATAAASAIAGAIADCRRDFAE